MKNLPQCGTAALLEVLSPHLDDDLIEAVMPMRAGRGRRPLFRAAQLFRVQLLSLLTPAHSFNLLVALLAENRLWREFARLPNKRVLPDAKMLHQFRDRLDLGQLRGINKQLLLPLLEPLDPQRQMVAILDSTDLPAATNDYKKNSLPLLGQRGGRGGAHGQKRSESLVYRL